MKHGRRRLTTFCGRWNRNNAIAGSAGGQTQEYMTTENRRAAPTRAATRPEAQSEGSPICPGTRHEDCDAMPCHHDNIKKKRKKKKKVSVTCQGIGSRR